jgi:hypothetical protein
MPLAGPRSMKMVVGAKTLLISPFCGLARGEGFCPRWQGGRRAFCGRGSTIIFLQCLDLMKAIFTGD